MPAEENQLVTYAKENQLDDTRVKALLADFGEPFNQAQEIIASAQQLSITEEGQTELMAEARKKRLALKEIRVRVEHSRKKVKEQALREGRAIDGMANIIKAMIVPAEEYLEKQEKFDETLAEERRKTRKAERAAKLLAYISESSLQAYNYADLSDEEFADLLSNVKIAYDKKIEDEKAAAETERLKAERIEKERLERIEAERLEQERIRQENEKLKAAEAERLRIENIAASLGQLYSDNYDGAEATQALTDLEVAINGLAESDAQNEVIINAFLDVQDKLKKHLEYLAKEEAAQAERVAAAEKQRIADEKLAAERAAREKLEEAKRLEEERAAKEEADRLEAERRAAAAPDKDKLMEVVDNLAAPIVLELDTDEARKILNRINTHRASAVEIYKQEISRL